MYIQGCVKREFEKRLKSLRDEYQHWVPAWKEIQTYISPKRGSFDAVPSERAKMIDHRTLLNDHATKATRVASSGLVSGMTSPSRPWIRLGLDNKDAEDMPEVREWLDEVANRMLAICNDSNVYSVFQSMYEELLAFGQACAIFLEDYDTVIWGRNFTIGEYYLGTDDRGKMNAFGRTFYLTIGQMVRQFGYDNCSPGVQAQYDGGKVDVWIKINHLIEPNDKRIGELPGYRNMPYRSAYWEDGEGDEFLAIRGFEEFPILGPRWDTSTTDQVYGYGPGWFVLGDVKELQRTQLDKMLAQEKLHNPPMQADGSVVNNAVNLLPGGITRVSQNVPNAGVRPAYQIADNLESFIEALNDLKERIDKDFFVHLFLMLMNIDKTNMTATEIAERQQEKIMMLGPVLERLRKEMLDPFFERLYNVMYRNMLIPPPPEAISEMPIKITYISILSQAQKALGLISIEKILNMAMTIATIKPDAIDVVDIDEAIRQAADMEAVPGKIIVDPQVVIQIRNQRMQAEQMRQSAELAASGADTAKKLADANPEGSLLEGMQQAIQ
jgi:hypothetical protein